MSFKKQPQKSSQAFFSKKSFIFFFIFFLTIFTRFYKLDWGDSLFFHPDENNMASSVSKLEIGDLNPHFFAYGQFPLYLGFFTLHLFKLHNTFINSIMILRFYSAFFSSISLIIFYLISKKLFFSFKQTVLLLLILIFTPGLIQLAHFGTTESLLIFIFSANILLAINFYKNQSFVNIFLSSIITGIGLASKITSLFFLGPILLSIFFTFFKSNKKNYLLLVTSYLLLNSFIFFLFFSPYNLTANSNFKSTLDYETSLAVGKTKVFYTNQFLDSIPILFQFTKIFPYAIGLLVLTFSILGFTFLIKSFINKSYLINHKSLAIYWLIILIPSSVYFFYNSFLYTKWFRFMSPVFFIFPFLSILFFQQIKKHKLISKILTIFSILPGIIFFSIYIKPDIRTTASNWLNQNIPPNTKILSEAGNVVNLPVTHHQFDINNFDFYNLDTNSDLPKELVNQIHQSHYILIPSRRMFKNQYRRHPESELSDEGSPFPYSQKYYQALFSGQLGFKKIKQFSVFPSFLSDENAEETFSVFDHPVIRVYKKQNYLSKEEIENLIL
ncbi:glycosyltransferase family 39 protein [Patescibacteria group bacterium]|nr:glycosyltransferase family 39 protein [Patescibacteria group bacterium]